MQHLKTGINFQGIVQLRGCYLESMMMLGGRHHLEHQLCESWTGIAVEEDSLTQWQLPLPSKAEVI